MTPDQLREIADMCDEAIQVVPLGGTQNQQQVSEMFERLQGIAAVCIDNLELSSMLKGCVPLRRQGALYNSARAIHGMHIFSGSEGAGICSHLSAISRTLRDVAAGLDPQDRLRRGDFSVFYSWQSDLPNCTNRGFIRSAIEKALKSLKGKCNFTFQPIIESDTANTPGSPDVINDILKNIDKASIFISDVSITASGIPNPNVMFELGYAIKALTSGRIIMVFNEAFGEPSRLPFDLGFKRQLLYKMEEGAHDRATERNRLGNAIERSIKMIIDGLSSAN